MTQRTDNAPAGEQGDERRVIRVDGVPDQAHLASLLRRAFEVGRPTEADDDFAALLQRIH